MDYLPRIIDTELDLRLRAVGAPVQAYTRPDGVHVIPISALRDKV